MWWGGECTFFAIAPCTSPAAMSGQRLQDGKREGVEGTLIFPAWRWLVLLAFSCNTAGNAFMFMDFTTLPDITKEAFHLCANCTGGDQTIAWTYSASLVAGESCVACDVVQCPSAR